MSLTFNTQTNLHKTVTKAPKREYQICTRCVMDTSDPWITFDSYGNCNHCASFFFRYTNRVTPNLTNDENRLEKLFSTIRAANNRKTSGYDAIMGISGGTDSSYCALLAAKAGLRILAVHLDNGWDTPSALANVYKIINLPNIDYVSYVLDWNQFRATQRAFIESGVPDIELPTDIAIFKALYLTSKKYKITTAITGGNISNEGILPVGWMYNTRDMKYLSSIARSQGLPVNQYRQLRFGLRDEVYHRLIRRHHTYYPLDTIKYDKKLAARRLKDEIGWQPHSCKHGESIFTRFTQLIYQPRRHGFEYRRAHLSSDICMNRISRNDALELLSNPAMNHLEESRDIRFVAGKLRYTTDELISIMSQPPRWYVDFPNRHRALGLVYDTYRLLKCERKLSNF